MIPEDKDIFDEVLGDYSLEKVFYSKKNQVCLINTAKWGRCVIKIFTDKDSCSREKDILKHLNAEGVPVPEIYQEGEDYIVLEYIEGPTLLDTVSLLEDEGQDIRPIVSMLSLWLNNFYTALKYSEETYTVLYDVNFRNIIVGNKIYGIDFEDCRVGCIEEDIGRLLAFLITYTPEFTDWKMDMVKKTACILISELGLNRGFVYKEFSRELVNIGERRAINIPAGIINILVNGCEKRPALTK